MIVLGVLCLLVEWLSGIGPLAPIGWVLISVGVVVFVLGSGGLPVGGRRFWW